MDGTQSISKAPRPAATGIQCMHCGYDLRGSPSERCPECGKLFDPLRFRRLARRRWIISLVVMAFVMYAPFGWLFFVDDDPGYVRSWMMLGPVLPGLVPTHLVAATIFRRPFDDTVFYVASTAFTLAALLGFAWLGRKSRTMLVVAAIVLLALSCLNSFIALQLFRM